MEINLHQAVAMVREIPEEEEGETAMVLLQLVLPPMAQKSKQKVKYQPSTLRWTLMDLMEHHFNKIPYLNVMRPQLRKEALELLVVVVVLTDHHLEAMVKQNRVKALHG